jgi:hypothetical protein
MTPKHPYVWQVTSTCTSRVSYERYIILKKIGERVWDSRLKKKKVSRRVKR